MLLPVFYRLVDGVSARKVLHRTAIQENSGEPLNAGARVVYLVALKRRRWLVGIVQAYVEHWEKVVLRR